MSFELHITRKDDVFAKTPEAEIALTEWLAYIAGDHEFRLDNYAQTQLPDGTALRIEQDGIAVWTAYSEHGVDQNQAWFTYYRGTIDVKNPDQQIINKMVDVAAALKAKVLDDEGTVYEKEAHMDRQGKDVLLSPAPQKPWWKFW